MRKSIKAFHHPHFVSSMKELTNCSFVRNDSYIEFECYPITRKKYPEKQFIFYQQTLEENIMLQFF